jgi:alanine racemase
MTSVHAAWVEIDRAAMRDNFALARARLKAETEIWAVCKGDAYGAGIVESASVFLGAGATGIAISDLHDAERLRGAGIDAPVLLYGATDPVLASRVRELDLMPTIFDVTSLEAFAALGRPVDVWVEVDCGMGRLGFVPGEWEKAFERLRRAATLRLCGLYTHLVALEEPARVERQVALFREAAASAAKAGFARIPLMAASSRVTLDYPDLQFDAVNPGRFLFGLFEGRWAGRVPARNAISAVKARILQVKDLAPGARLGYGGDTGSDTIRAVVLPIGFVAGLPREYRGTALIRGRHCPVLGLSSMEHLVVDASAAPDAQPGDEAVLLGRQGDAEIKPADIAAASGLEVLEMLPRFGRGLPRVYVN